MMAGTLIILVTLAVYVFSQSYQKVHEKCEIFLLVGIAMIYFSLALVEWSFGVVQLSMLLLSILFSFLWSTILCHDIWWSFSHPGAMVDENIKIIKFYYFYGFATMPLVFMVTFVFTRFEHHVGRNLSNSIVSMVLLLLFITACVDLFMLGATGFKLFQMTKEANFHDQVWFEAQKERQACKLRCSTF